MRPNCTRIKSADRTAKGRFARGNPGGPGRPPGRGPAAELRAALAGDIHPILAKMAEMALAGDVAAARVIIDRVLPTLKAEELPAAMALPDGTLTEQGRAVLAAVASGGLAPSQGAALIGAIGGLARVAEIDELARRVADLERRHDAARKT